MSQHLFLHVKFHHNQCCGSGTLDPGWVKNQDFGSWMNITDHISESLETIFGFKNLKFFDADVNPDTEYGNLFDPGSGMEKIRMRDKHPGYATLVTTRKLPTSCPSVGSSWRGAPLRQWP
jgi:hypothetical protein